MILNYAELIKMTIRHACVYRDYRSLKHTLTHICVDLGSGYMGVYTYKHTKSLEL